MWLLFLMKGGFFWLRLSLTPQIDGEKLRFSLSWWYSMKQIASDYDSLQFKLFYCLDWSWLTVSSFIFLGQRSPGHIWGIRLGLVCQPWPCATLAPCKADTLHFSAPQFALSSLSQDQPQLPVKCVWAGSKSHHTGFSLFFTLPVFTSLYSRAETKISPFTPHNEI